MKNLTLLGLIPLRNFGVIIESPTPIYRSAQPIAHHEYEWVKDKLGVKHIFNLREESRHDQHFAVEGCTVHQFDVPDHHPPTLEEAKSYIKMIRKLKSPVLIHCEHGQGRTSSFSVLTKIAAGWSVEDAINDEIHRFKYDFRHPSQLRFLRENFK